MSKSVERVIASRLVGYLNMHGLMPQLQSVYRRHHSTETALLKVLSDIYAAVDSQQVVLLGLLDLSAAFDCVDHEVLLRRLRVRFGICGTAHDWIASFLSGRSQRVLYRGRLSAEWSCCLAFPRAQSWAAYCSCCIRLNSSTSSQNAVSQITRTPTTRRSTSAHQPLTTSTPWTGLQVAACIERTRDWMSHFIVRLSVAVCRVCVLVVSGPRCLK